MRGQNSPVTKGKIETAFAQLDRLGLGKDGENVADAQVSLRQAHLLRLVTSASSELTY